MIGLPFNYNIAFDFCDLYYFCYETGLLQEHLVLGLEVSDGIVNLLCRAVVVLSEQASPIGMPSGRCSALPASW